eukprot:GDKJ01044723.1.p1 GENE.GDKJ01044723.1~~GDKJ01044723.1.p1  ORF type:complete len:414 (-),score=113.27 GDKJ01044723.1:189-1430(-)
MAGKNDALSLTNGPRRERETVREFISKKREMFLVQMSLDIKRAEILKLHERAAMKERALRQSQIMLEQDVTRFDTFLQANDARAHKAMKEAEEMMRIKTQKVAEVKALQADIAAITSEIEKHKEARAECQKYKKFLEALTPADKRKELEQKRAERRVQRKTIQSHLNSGGSDSESDLSDDEPNNFFQRPEQLMEQFATMEALNLSYIQAAQESEIALEDVKEKFAKDRERMETDHEALESTISALSQKVEEEKEKCRQLEEVLNRRNSTSAQQKLMDELTEKVKEVYTACTDSDKFVVDGSDPLKMLTFVERKLELYLLQLGAASNRARVDVLENAKEKHRRDETRKNKIRAEEERQKDRMSTSLQRAQQPVKQKIGKPLMARSPPLKREVKIVKRNYVEEREKKEQILFFSP